MAVMATSLLCFALPANAADVYITPDHFANGVRKLAVCPSQVDTYQGISPEVDWKGFEERDLVILKLTDTEAYLIFQDFWGVKRFKASQDDLPKIRQRTNCKSEDSYVLIGKDGGVKRRWSGQVGLGDLFQTIDAMPMRRYEIRQKADKN